jgi:hypothetical protein
MWGCNVITGGKYLNRVKLVAESQGQGKMWHTKLNGVNVVTKPQTEGMMWNSLCFKEMFFLF